MFKQEHKYHRTQTAEDALEHMLPPSPFILDSFKSDAGEGKQSDFNFKVSHSRAL